MQKYKHNDEPATNYLRIRGDKFVDNFTVYINLEQKMQITAGYAELLHQASQGYGRYALRNRRALASGAPRALRLLCVTLKA